MAEAPSSTPGICSLCLKGSVKYTCPRCNIQYCSSACYKGEAHSQCSEAFYKDCFMQGLEEMESSSDEKQKMMDMLKRLHDEQLEEDLDSDDESEEDLADRIAGLDLDKDTDKIWDVLTDKEKHEFEDMMKDGRMANLVPVYEPWWLRKVDLVEQIDSDKKSESNERKSAAPAALCNIPDFDAICKKQPSGDIPCNVVNILYGYCYIVRLYDGDFNTKNCAFEMMQLSEVLTGKSFSDPPSALHACMQNLQPSAKNLFVSQDFSVGIVQDLLCILQGPSKRGSVDYVISALSDIHSVLRKTKKGINSELKAVEDETKRAQILNEKQQCFNVVKKLEFYLSWVVKYGGVLCDMIPVLDIEFCTLTTNFDKHQKDVEKLEQNWGGKRPPKKLHKLIEEI